MKQKILCTGSAGSLINNFIRKAIYEKLPYDFVSIDKVIKSSALNSIYSNKNHTFYIGDVADEHFIDIIFELEKPDIIIHGAVETINNKDLIHTNIAGTQVLVNAAIKFGIKKFIYLSDANVYGNLTEKNDLSWIKTDGFPIKEGSTLNPTTQYAATKAAGELIVIAAGNSSGLNYNITRATNNYGPRQGIDKFIPKTIKSILENQKITVYGKGLNVRDWLHVFDNSSALIKILELGSNREIYNISAHQEFTNIEVVNEICNVLGKGFNLVEFVEDKVPHDFRRAADASKLLALGWAPDYKFRGGIRTTIEWYLNNRYCLK